MVLDNYAYTNSLKTDERDRRSRGKVDIVIQIANCATQVPIKWSDYLSVTENKRVLERFLYKYWVQNAQTLLKEGETKVASLEGKAYMMTDGRTIHLSCNNHKEADTLIILHCKGLMKTHQEL